MPSDPKPSAPSPEDRARPWGTLPQIDPDPDAPMCGVVNGKIICCRSRGHVGSHATPFPSQRRHGPVWIFWGGPPLGPFGSCHENDPATHLYCGLEKGHEGDHLSPSNQGPGATLAEWSAASPPSPARDPDPGAVSDEDLDGMEQSGVVLPEEVPLLVAEVRASRASPPPGPDLAPWYEADGSTVMLPAEEVERRRKLAAKVIEAARKVSDAADLWVVAGTEAPSSYDVPPEPMAALRSSLDALAGASGSSAPRPEGFPDDVPALTRELCAAVIEDDEMGGDLRSGTATRARALVRSLDALAAGVRPEGHADDPGETILLCQRWTAQQQHMKDGILALAEEWRKRDASYVIPRAAWDRAARELLTEWDRLALSFEAPGAAGSSAPSSAEPRCTVCGDSGYVTTDPKEPEPECPSCDFWERRAAEGHADDPGRGQATASERFDAAVIALSMAWRCGVQSEIAAARTALEVVYCDLVAEAEERWRLRSLTSRGGGSRKDG